MKCLSKRAVGSVLFFFTVLEKNSRLAVHRKKKSCGQLLAKTYIKKTPFHHKDCFAVCNINNVGNVEGKQAYNHLAEMQKYHFSKQV